MNPTHSRFSLRAAALFLCCLLLVSAGVMAAFADDPEEVTFTVQWWDVEWEEPIGDVGGTYDLYVNGEQVYDDWSWSQELTLPAGSAYEVTDVRLNDDSMFVLVPNQTWSGTVESDWDTADLLVYGPRSYSVLSVTSEFDENEDYNGYAWDYRYDVYHDGVLVAQDVSGDYYNSCRYGTTVEVKNIRTPGNTGTEGVVMPETYNLSFTPEGDDYEVELTLPPLFLLDVNVVLDGNGSYMTGIEGCTFDVTVGGAYAAQNVEDYCAGVPAGLTYEVKNIHIPEGYYPTYTGPRAGTVTGYHEEAIGLRTHEWNAATISSLPSEYDGGSILYTCSDCEETREPNIARIHNVDDTACEAILYLTWEGVTYVLTNDNGAIVAAPYASNSAAQRWRFEPQEIDGSYRVYSVADGKALTLGGYARNGYAYRNVTLATPDNSTEQLWLTNGYWSIGLYSAAEPVSLSLTSSENGEAPTVCCSTDYREWECHEILDEGADFTADFLFRDEQTSSVSVTGNNVVIDEFAGALSQQWQFTRLANGAYKILNRQDGKALTAAGTQEGSNVCLAAYTGADSQQWFLLDATYGNFFLQPASSLCVIDMTDGDTTSGTNIQLWTMHYGWQEQWTILRYADLGESFTAWVMNAYDARPVCCAATDDVEYNLEVHSFLDDIFVPWTFTRLADGGYTISGRDGELVWTYNEETYNVELSAATGAANQEWFIYHGWDGCYQLRISGTNRMLDLLYGGGEYINVQTYTRHADAPEQWSIQKTTDFPDRFYAELRWTDTDNALASDVYEDVLLSAYTGSAWQRWLFTRQADGTYTVRNTQDDRLLAMDENHIYLSTSDVERDNNRLTWRIFAMPDGGYTLSCVRVWDAQGSSFLAWDDYHVVESTPSNTAILWDVKVLEELTTFTLSKSSFAYTGAVQRPAVTVKNAAGEVLTEGTDYTLTPAAGSKDVGSYTVKIKGKGDYIGNPSKTYKIVPATVTDLTAAPSAANELTLNWSAAPGAKTYYIYQYDAAGDAYAYIGSTSQTSYAVSELAAWETASFKVRSVAKVGSTTYYGGYSDAAEALVLGKPAMPQNAAAEATAANELTLRWTASEGATQYNIYRKAEGASSFSYLGTAFNTQYTAKKLTAGVSYTFRITPVTKGSGLTLVGETPAEITGQAIAVPTVPTGVTAKATGEKTITVSWTAADNAMRYDVYRYNGTRKEYVCIGTTEGTSYEVTGLSAGTNYYFKVLAASFADELILESGLSASVNTRALGTPAVPKNVTAAATAERTVTVSWSASANATQYNVYRYNGAKKTYVYIGTTAETAYRSTGLSAGTTYYFKVVAVVKGEGLTFASDKSAAASAKALGTPAVPADVTARASAAKTITVSWTAVPNATQYNVYRYNEAKDAYAYKGTVYADAENPTAYEDRNLTAGTVYSYKIVAVTKEAGLTFASDKSAAAEATALGAPAVPAGVSARATAEKAITVSWTAVPGATQYDVYRYNGAQKTYLYKGTVFADGETPTAYIDAGLNAGTTYHYKVVAVTKEGDLTLESAKSADASAKAVGTPAVPTGVTAASAGDQKITVSWNAVPNATQYNVYRYNGTKKTYVYKGTVYASGETPTSYTDAGLNVGTTYYYKVVAVVKTADLTLASEKSASAHAKAE